MKGTLVIGHGSRVRKVNDEFQEFIKILRKVAKVGVEVQGANLTLATPSVEEKIEEMYCNGFREIQVIPYFLSNGKHVIKNIPEILEDLELKYDNLIFNLESSLLLNPLVIQAVAHKIAK